MPAFETTNGHPENETIRVLIVEDDEDDYVLTTSLLAEIGADRFEIEWISTYDAALEKVAGSEHDVWLLDYRLGAHNGLDLLRAAQAGGFGVPIILLTGQGDHEIDVEAMKAGAADFLVKGQINAANLERSIRYAIQKRQMEDERAKTIRHQEARIQAEAANRAKDEFLAMVSHELRSPLNAMLGWVGILRVNKDKSDVLSRALDAIDRSARVQAKLINDLLDITRIANGSLWVEKVPTPLVAVIESSIDEAYPAATSKGVDLQISLDRSIGTIAGDPSRLQQVFNNLILNAIKFTPAGGKVTVKAEAVGSAARVTVTDTGKGISEEFLPFVFDRYRQSSEENRGQTGLGLGLAIARHIAELHGGSITAQSPGEGKGATFTVELPLETAAVISHDAATSAA